MRRNLIDIVCCPDDKEVLELRDAKEDDHGDVLAGKLHCPECGFDFPIEDGIPNLLPKEFHLAKGGAGARGKQRGAQGSKADKSSAGGAKAGATKASREAGASAPSGGTPSGAGSAGDDSEE